MHELGLAQRIVDAAVEAAGGRGLRRVHVRVGAIHASDPALLAEAFEIAALGTPAEGAVLGVVVLPIRISCRDCGEVTASDDPMAACGRCGSFDVERTGGDELELESVSLTAEGRAFGAEGPH